MANIIPISAKALAQKLGITESDIKDYECVENALIPHAVESVLVEWYQAGGIDEEAFLTEKVSNKLLQNSVVYAVDTAFDYVLYLFFPKTGVLGELDDETQRSW